MVKVGIELIVFQGREREDLDGVLKDCAEAGYDSVETGFIFDKYRPQQIREVFEKYHLEYAAGHGGYDTIGNEAKLEETIKNIKDAGGSYIICSGVAKGEGSAGYKEAAKVFNKVGKLAEDAGLIFCYHNHSSEFEIVEGKKGIDILGEETDANLVKFNVDTAWVQVGGEEPAQFIQRYRDRVGYYHFKDAFIKGKEITWTELGKGDVNLRPAYEMAMRFNPAYFIYEEDVSRIEIKQAIKESREFLKGLGV